MERKPFSVYNVSTIFVAYCPIYKNCYLDIHGKVGALSLTSIIILGNICYITQPSFITDQI